MADVIVNLRIKADGSAEVVKLTDGLKGLNDQQKKQQESSEHSAKSLEHLAEAAIEGHVSIGQLAVAMGATGLQGAVLAKGVELANEAVKGSVEFIAEAIEKTAQYAIATERTATTTGLSAKAVQELGVMARLAGADQATLTKATVTLEKQLVTNSAAFRALGMSQKELIASSPQQALIATAKAIDEIHNPIERAAAGATIFKKQWVELAPMLHEVAEAGLDAGSKLNHVLPDDAIAKSAEFHHATTELSIAWEGVVLQFGAAAMSGGGLTTMVKTLTSTTVELSQWVTSHRDDIGNVFQAGAVMAKDLLSWVKDLKPVLVDIIDLAGKAFKYGSIAGYAISSRAEAELQLAAATADTKAFMDKQYGKTDLSQLSPGAGHLSGTNPFAHPAAGGTGEGGGGFDLEAAKEMEAFIKQQEKAQLEMGQLTGYFNSHHQQLESNTGAYMHLISQVQKLASEGARLPAVFDAIINHSRLVGDPNAPGFVGPPSPFGPTSSTLPEGADWLMNEYKPGLSQLAGGGMGSTHQLMDTAAVQARINANFERTRIAMESTTHATFNWHEALQGVANTFQVLGISAESVLGRIVGGITAAAAAGQQMHSALNVAVLGPDGKPVIGADGKPMHTQDKASVAASGLQGLAALYQSAYGHGALQGAGAGAIQGSAFGGEVGGGKGALIGAGVGAVAGAIFGLFGHKDKDASAASESLQQFLKDSGGFDELKKHADAAHVSLDALFNAHNARDMKAAIDGVNNAIGDHERLLQDQAAAQDKVREAAQKYGLTIDEMGSKWAQQELDKKAGSLLQDWTLLNEAGADHNAILTKMAPALNEYLQTAIRTGATIPESMRPALQGIVDLGLATDESGNKLKSLDGAKFTDDLEHGMKDVIDQIKELVKALQGIPNVTTTVTVVRKVVNPGGGTEPPPPPPDGGGGPTTDPGDWNPGWGDPPEPHARGTISTTPHLAIIHGSPGNPEIVAPLDALLRSIGAGVATAQAGGGGGRSVTFAEGSIIVNGAADPQAAAEAVVSAIRRNLAGLQDEIKRQ